MRRANSACIRRCRVSKRGNFVPWALCGARKFGVHRAMRGSQGGNFCPQAFFLPTRRRPYVDFSRKVFAVLAQYSPEVHALSIDEGLVDLTGTERLFGPPLKTADAIIRRIDTDLGLPSSAGLSTSRVTAKIAATMAKPRGLIYVPARSEKDFLAPLAVEMIPGVGPKTHKTLNQKSIKTIGDLLTPAELAARYLGPDQAAAQPPRHDHSIGIQTPFHQPVQQIG